MTDDVLGTGKDLAAKNGYSLYFFLQKLYELTQFEESRKVRNMKNYYFQAESKSIINICCYY